MTSCIKGVVALSLTCIAVDAFATFVSESDVRKAAEAFVSTDTIGSSVLSGRSVAGASKRDGLWIVALAPSGHVIFSGSDLVDPIVGFSENDFVEPDPKSPAYSVLEGASASVAAMEAQGGGTRHARWTKLLGGGGRPMLKAADIESPDTVVIPPFLKSHYNQWQPYNDYAPVYEASTNNLGVYRGRCPCGCVATATAQGLRHFRWPARIDRVDSFDHNFTDANENTTPFPLRFDGHLPMDWAALEDDYDSDAGGEWIPDPDRPGTGWQIWKAHTDLRGTVPEATRHPIARLIMFADVLAHMSFGADGSGANYGMVSYNASDWYKRGTWVPATDSRVLADITNGVPVQVTIPGHAVVGHGWANDGSNKYLYLNYGWGGSNDGYYNINGSTIQEVYVGHYPRAKPQIDPLPKVCETNPTLNWHFPDFYTNNLSGFTVSISSPAATPSTFLDDFSSSSGSSSSSGIYVVTDNDYGYDGNLLHTTASTTGTYTFPDSYLLTSASVLTFKLLSISALGAVYEVQASFNGGDWETICTPLLMLDWGISGWATERVYLGGHGGESVRFRVRNSRNSGSFYSTGKILLDDFTVTKVLAPVEPEIRNVDKTVRSLVLNGLAAGATYSFAVTPIISGALVDGESSESVSTSIAGLRNMPIPGEQTYTPATLSFSAFDTSGTWTYSGTVVDDTTILDKSECSISIVISGMLTASSSLSFGWSANNYYGNGSDTLTAVFTAIDGTETTVWETTNAANSDRRNVDISLAALAGLSGKIKISYKHSGSYYIGDQIGGRLYVPTVTNVLVPSVPDVAWETETLTSLGTPEILSVSAVSEGFYGECWTNTTTFAVQCSSSVTNLCAFSSHLSLVGDEDVSVSKVSDGKFKVCVTPSGINESSFRSRMILTLVGTDSNGTKCYKDLSLRFSQVEPKPTEVHVEATTSSGDAFSVDIPYSWIEENGLVTSGSDAAEYATADADSDGLPNWAEYVCGTDPSDPDDKLTASITMVDGEPVVTYTPADGIASGFKAVIKGTTNLAAALSTWEVVTDTRTSTCRFFRVEIVPEK